MAYLNQGLGFDEVRWAIMRKHPGGYDAFHSFQGAPTKILLPMGTVLFRLLYMATGTDFSGACWMPKEVFDELHRDANAAGHGGGKLFRNYVAQYLALPSGGISKRRCRAD